jgi:hypothetical protein
VAATSLTAWQTGHSTKNGKLCPGAADQPVRDDHSRQTGHCIEGIHRRYGRPQYRLAAVADRVDETGAAYAGSQLQLQLYVNERTQELNDELASEFPDLAGASIEWRSPLTADHYAEYWDEAFLDRVGCGEQIGALKAFWPTGGPHWDGLAVVHRDGETRPGVLLVEGKSYPGELRGGGCKAKAGSSSRKLIEEALGWTQQRLGVKGKTPADWCGPLYQTANRLAHLEWLRSRAVRAWLAHVLFVDDPHKPTTASEWSLAAKETNKELGLPDDGATDAGHILLPASQADELQA